jgi:hypothetical protein
MVFKASYGLIYRSIYFDCKFFHQFFGSVRTHIYEAEPKQNICIFVS